MQDFFRQHRPHDGLSYDEYLAAWRARKNADDESLDEKERRLREYVRSNYEHSEQVHGRYEPSEKLRRAVAGLEAPQLWMVLTEPWCADAAYNLPVIVEAARLSERVTLRLLLRDDNLDIMDQYRTDGGRSIPKLVAFSEEGEELFRWGPRPEEARRRYREHAGEDKQAAIEALLSFYTDGGWQQVEPELADAISRRAGQPHGRS